LNFFHTACFANFGNITALFTKRFKVKKD